MAASEPVVTRWPHTELPSAEGIERLMRSQGLAPYRWENRPGDRYAAHAHPYDKVIYVCRGSITFGLPERGVSLTLHAGDRLELPSGIGHDAVVAAEGVVCLEAHR